MTTEQALQQWLALEHEAVWFYAEVGGRFTALAADSRDSYRAHVGVRDALMDRLNRAGTEPVATALAYGVGTIRRPADASKIAQGLESRVASACLTLVGLVEGDGREFATAGLHRAALAELAWGAKPSAFPGLPA